MIFTKMTAWISFCFQYDLQSALHLFYWVYVPRALRWHCLKASMICRCPMPGE